MNERIKKLAEQAGATLIKGYIELSDGQLMLSDGADVDHTTMDLTKFAELLVRECAVIFTNNWTMTGSEPPISAVKTHFGVEK